MLSATLQQFVVRDARYKVAALDAVSVEMDGGAERSPSRIEAELLDISPGGVRICTTAPVAESDMLTITVSTGDPAGPIAVRAQVCWTTLTTKGRAYVGCSIEPTIPVAVLDHLAASGLLERRQDAHKAFKCKLPAQWELAPTAGEAEIVNLSPGGISLLMPQAGTVGRRICLTVPDITQKPSRVYVKARWSIQTEEGAVVGCEISDRSTYLRVAKLPVHADRRHALSRFWLSPHRSAHEVA